MADELQDAPWAPGGGGGDILPDAPWAASPDESDVTPPKPKGAIANAIAPITGYWSTYDEAQKGARGQMARGVEQLTTGRPPEEPGKSPSLWERTKSAANIGLGAMSYT